MSLSCVNVMIHVTNCVVFIVNTQSHIRFQVIRETLYDEIYLKHPYITKVTFINHCLSSSYIMIEWGKPTKNVK